MSEWRVYLSEEVHEWSVSLPVKELAQFRAVVERLRERGNLLSAPHSKPLGGGLFELRFKCGVNQQRVTYTYLPEKQAILLTAFRKQRNNERAEVARARRAVKKVKGD